MSQMVYLRQLLYKNHIPIAMKGSMNYKNFYSLFNLINLFLIVSINVLAQNETSSRSDFSIGVIADCQYCSDPGEGIRKYAASHGKLLQCVDYFNTLSLEYVIHLGDFIDRDFESFDVVIPIYNKLNVPKYHVLGNHDFFVSDEKKATVPSTLGLHSKYYDFELKGWRFVVLDGNDISFHAYSEHSEQYNQTENYYKQLGNEPPKWNGAIGAGQLLWLKGVLNKATDSNEKVILYCHFPVYPEDSIHNLWNSNEIIELIEANTCVKAYINGHNHAGNYAIKNGIHYFNLKGMVDTEETSYAVIHFFDDRLEVKGFGREEDREMKISK